VERLFALVPRKASQIAKGINEVIHYCAGKIVIDKLVYLGISLRAVLIHRLAEFFHWPLLL